MGKPSPGLVSLSTEALQPPGRAQRRGAPDWDGGVLGVTLQLDKSFNHHKMPFCLPKNGHMCVKGLTSPVKRFGPLSPAPGR